LTCLVTVRSRCCQFRCQKRTRSVWQRGGRVWQRGSWSPCAAGAARFRRSKGGPVLVISIDLCQGLWQSVLAGRERLPDREAARATVMLIFARSVAVLSGNDSGSGWCATKCECFEFEGEGAASPSHHPAHQQLGGEVRGDHVVVQLGKCNSGMVAAPLRSKAVCQVCRVSARPCGSCRPD
jgi:hypothetical protein